VRVTTDAAGVITKAEIKFSVWNRKTGAFEELTDLTTLKKNVHELAFELYDYSGGCGQAGRGEWREVMEDDADGVFTTTGMATKGFKFVTAANGGDAAVCAGESMTLMYNMNRTNFRFDFRHRWN
jgi:hypothetical protein